MADVLTRRALENITRRREAAEAEAAVRKEALYEEVPRLSSIDASLAEKTREIFSQIRSGEINESEASLLMQQFSAKAKSAREEALTNAGYTADALEVQYHCPLCRDQGYLSSGSPSAVSCSCLKKEVSRLSCGDLAVLLSDMSFSNADLSLFKDAAQRAVVEQVYQMALSFCKQFPTYDKQFVILSGEAGQGKTYLLACVARAVAEQGHNVAFVSAYQLFDWMRLAHLGDRESPARLQAMAEADLLLVDDLGAEPLYNNISTERFFALVNERQLYRRPMWIATNLSMNDMRSRYGERTLSRLIARDTGAAIRLSGEDLRRIKKD